MVVTILGGDYGWAKIRGQLYAEDQDTYTVCNILAEDLAEHHSKQATKSITSNT